MRGSRAFGEEAAALRALRAELIRQQGGENVITSLERLAIDSTLRTHLYLALIDHLYWPNKAPP